MKSKSLYQWIIIFPWITISIHNLFYFIFFKYLMMVKVKMVMLMRKKEKKMKKKLFFLPKSWVISYIMWKILNQMVNLFLILLPEKKSLLFLEMHFVFCLVATLHIFTVIICFTWNFMKLWCKNRLIFW